LELDRVIGIERIVGHGRILMPAPAFANRGLRKIFTPGLRFGDSNPALPTYFSIRPCRRIF
jgi:hypothetical protein